MTVKSIIQEEPLILLENERIALKLHNSYPVTFFWGQLIMWPLCRFFIRIRMKPNSITLLMILSGLLGSLCIALPSFVALCFGSILIQLFQILDDCDGCIARCTRTFSRYGVELDYLAHVICHPVMNCAFGMAIYRRGIIEADLMLLLLGLHTVIELARRALIGLVLVDTTKAKCRGEAIPVQTNQPYSPKWWLLYSLSFFYIFPIYAMIMPFFLVIDSISGSQLALLYLSVSTLVSFFMIVFSILKLTRKYYVS